MTECSMIEDEIVGDACTDEVDQSTEDPID